MRMDRRRCIINITPCSVVFSMKGKTLQRIILEDKCRIEKSLIKYSCSPFCSLILSLFTVCSVRVIGESDIMQEFLSESDEVSQMNHDIQYAFHIFDLINWL